MSQITESLAALQADMRQIGLSEIHRATGIGLRQLQRVRDGEVSPTVRTVEQISAGVERIRAKAARPTRRSARAKRGA